jgi:GTP-binding protein HflX
MFDLESERRGERVLLVGAGSGSAYRGSEENTLEELAQLARTAGAEVVERVFQRRRRMDPSTFVGKGKVSELKEVSESLDIEAFIFDDDLSPTQGRNLEELLDRKVIDRSELILDIFAQHARTQEAKIEVELAQLYYRLPRLVGKGIALSRLGGGIGTRGPGEQKLEVDRRRIRERISRLKKKLVEVEKSKMIQRKGRENFFRIALVGYTNSGKSTLMNRLTQAQVKIEEGLFSTLDSTTRRLEYGMRGPNVGTSQSSVRYPYSSKILITDTVGFIRKLPHHLITSFHSTLQEAVEADLRLQIVDVSHPDARRQMETSLEILEELGCLEEPILFVFNKMDLADYSVVEKLLSAHQPSCAISALRGEGLDLLVEMVVREMESCFVETEILLPPAPSEKRRLLSQIYRVGEVVETGWREGKVKVLVRLRKEHLEMILKSIKV